MASFKSKSVSGVNPNLNNSKPAKSGFSLGGIFGSKKKINSPTGPFKVYNPLFYPESNKRVSAKPVTTFTDFRGPHRPWSIENKTQEKTGTYTNPFNNPKENISSSTTTPLPSTKKRTFKNTLRGRYQQKVLEGAEKNSFLAKQAEVEEKIKQIIINTKQQQESAEKATENAVNIYKKLTPTEIVAKNLLSPKEQEKLTSILKKAKTNANLLGHHQLIFKKSSTTNNTSIEKINHNEKNRILQTIQSKALKQVFNDRFGVDKEKAKRAKQAVIEADKLRKELYESHGLEYENPAEAKIKKFTNQQILNQNLSNLVKKGNNTKRTYAKKAETIDFSNPLYEPTYANLLATTGVQPDIAYNTATTREEGNKSLFLPFKKSPKSHKHNLLPEGSIPSVTQDPEYNTAPFKVKGQYQDVPPFSGEKGYTGLLPTGKKFYTSGKGYTNLSPVVTEYSPVNRKNIENLLAEGNYDVSVPNVVSVGKYRPGYRDPFLISGNPGSSGYASVAGEEVSYANVGQREGDYESVDEIAAKFSQGSVKSSSAQPAVPPRGSSQKINIPVPAEVSATVPAEVPAVKPLYSVPKPKAERKGASAPPNSVEVSGYSVPLATNADQAYANPTEVLAASASLPGNASKSSVLGKKPYVDPLNSLNLTNAQFANLNENAFVDPAAQPLKKPGFFKSLLRRNPSTKKANTSGNTKKGGIKNWLKSLTKKSAPKQNVPAAARSNYVDISPGENIPLSNLSRSSSIVNTSGRPRIAETRLNSSPAEDPSSLVPFTRRLSVLSGESLDERVAGTKATSIAASLAPQQAKVNNNVATQKLQRQQEIEAEKFFSLGSNALREIEQSNADADARLERNVVESSKQAAEDFARQLPSFSRPKIEKNQNATSLSQEDERDLAEAFPEYEDAILQVPKAAVKPGPKTAAQPGPKASAAKPTLTANKRLNLGLSILERQFKVRKGNNSQKVKQPASVSVKKPEDFTAGEKKKISELRQLNTELNSIKNKTTRSPSQINRLERYYNSLYSAFKTNLINEEEYKRIGKKFLKIIRIDSKP